jgi:hypothetical protein
MADLSNIVILTGAGVSAESGIAPRGSARVRPEWRRASLPSPGVLYGLPDQGRAS